MKYLIILFCVVLSVIGLRFKEEAKPKCDCQSMRKCYKTMLKELTREGEVQCISETTIGGATIMVFLKALEQYCSEFISVTSEIVTYEEREIIQVTITHFENTNGTRVDEDLPVVLLEAGQDVHRYPIFLALYITEQLVACQENEYMLRKLKWIILPSSNPDGLAYSRFNRLWKKNMSKLVDKIGFGVDITKNFDVNWDQCEAESTSLSPTYRGPMANSENETMYIINVLKKYSKNILVYVSIRGEGHGLGMPYAYTDRKQLQNEDLFRKIVTYLAAKANRKMGNLQSFSHSTIFQQKGKPLCGHSVDFAQAMGINSVEWDVYHGENDKFLQKFHEVPTNHLSALRSGYFSLIREVHNIYTKFDKFKVFFLQDFDRIYSL